MEYSRRLMIGAVALPAIVALGVLMGCKPTATPVVASQVVQDVQLIDAGVQALVPVVLSITTLSPADVISINQYIAIEHTAAAAIMSAATAATDPATFSSFGTAIKTLGPIVLKYLPAASPYAAAMQAALSLLPVVLAAVGIVMAQAAPPTMAPAEARLILARYK